MRDDLYGRLVYKYTSFLFFYGIEANVMSALFHRSETYHIPSDIFIRKNRTPKILENS